MRATGISLIAPVVLLVSATLVAASGGGFGGVESLGQIAAGPPLPEIGVAAAPPSSLGNEELAAIPPAPSPRTAAPGAPISPGAATAPPAPPPVPRSAPNSPADDRQLAQQTAPADPPSSSAPVAQLPPPAASAPPTGGPAVQGPRAPVRDLLDQVREGLPQIPIVDPALDEIFNKIVPPGPG